MVAVFSWTLSEPQVPADVPVVGKASVSNLQETYERWATAYGVAAPTGPVVSLLWSRGLSTEHSRAKGIAQFNLEKGTVSVRVKGLEDPSISDVWLVDNHPGFGRTVAPEPGDQMVKAGSLQFEGDNAWLDGQIAAPSDFQVDLVVVARRDASPDRNGVLVGTTSLFQKIYHYPEQTPAPWQQATALESSLMRAAAATGVTPPGFFPNLDSNLINKGRKIFFNETFNGNGRTCGTCHKEDDNMDAVPLFEKARIILKKALPSANNPKLEMAIKKLEEAQRAMVERS